LVGHTAAGVAWLGSLLDTRPDGDPPVWSAGEYMGLFPVRSPDDFDADFTGTAAARASAVPSAARRKR